MKKVVTILGARPQFIKGAVLSRIFRKNQVIEEVIIHTGQHFDDNMSKVFFKEMNIPKPKYNLEVNNLPHGAMTGIMLQKIEPILMMEKPDAVIVYGDTNSTIAGALAAKKLDIKVVHIEAGLRSFNMKMPEEINRILTDRVSDLLICPTENALLNLTKEGFGSFPVKIKQHGDIMNDAVVYYNAISKKESKIMDNLKLKTNEFVLATIHRQENTNDILQLQEILSALEQIHQSKQVILPLHPRTKKIMSDFNLNPSITIIDPVGYFDILQLLQHCYLTVTDSGGLQKEAFFTKKNCIVVRTETEWVELVSNGFALVTGSSKDEIIKAYRHFSSVKMDFNLDLYGTNVGEKIHNSILNLITN